MGGQRVFVENWTNYDHTSTCFVYSGKVMLVLQAGARQGQRRDFEPFVGLKSWVELSHPRPGQLGRQWGRHHSPQLFRIQKFRLRCWQVQCREPKTGQLKVQLYYEDEPLCPSSYIIYQWSWCNCNSCLLLWSEPYQYTYDATVLLTLPYLAWKERTVLNLKKRTKKCYRLKSHGGEVL